MHEQNVDVCVTTQIAVLMLRCYETLRQAKSRGKKNCQRQQTCRWYLCELRQQWNLRGSTEMWRIWGMAFFSFFIVLKITSSEMWIFLGLFICYRQWHPRDRSVQSVLNVSMTKTNVLGCWVLDTASARVAWKGYSVVTLLIVPNAEIQLPFLLGSMAC